MCEKYQKRHPTYLHDENFKEHQKPMHLNGGDISKNKADTTERSATAITNAWVIQEGLNTQTSSILPVWVSSIKQPGQELLVYALLDTQSDTTFILDEVAQDLNTNKENVSLWLSTMSTKSTVIPCQKQTGLQVRGYDSRKRIPLPPVFAQEFIPAIRLHIPTSETALKWPHLEQMSERIPPQLDCEVGLLIGYDCQQALLPRKILSGDENHPYAQWTDLGWSIVGCPHPASDYSDAIGTIHRIIVRQVTPAVHSSVQLKKEVHFVCRTQVKETNPPDIIKTLELDFTDHSADDNPVSQEDLFLSKVKAGIRQKMVTVNSCLLSKLTNLIFKTINSKQFSSLARRLRRSKQYYTDYVNFMNDIISRRDGEKVPQFDLDKQPAWYISHYGVYNPHKSGKSVWFSTVRHAIKKSL